MCLLLIYSTLIVPEAGWRASWEAWLGSIPSAEQSGIFQSPAVPSRKPAARSSKSIAALRGQMTTRLVWRSTSFHNMWPGLLNQKQGLGEKIFPCTKSDLAPGGPGGCESELHPRLPPHYRGAKTKHSFSPPSQDILFTILYCSSISPMDQLHHLCHDWT